MCPPKNQQNFQRGTHASQVYQKEHWLIQEMFHQMFLQHLLHQIKVFPWCNPKRYRRLLVVQDTSVVSSIMTEKKLSSIWMQFHWLYISLE